MNIAYLLTGSNQENPLSQLSEAKKRIESCCGHIIASSSIYETAAWGFEDQPSFLNQALELETPLSAEQLMQSLLQVEQDMGRVRIQKFGPRIIDIDILFFNHDVLKTRLLSVPHPHLQERKFALIPLTELAPNYFHPVLQQTVEDLLEACADQLEVKKMDV